MSYWERRRRGIVHPPSFPSSLSSYPGRVSQFSPVEQLPFPDSLSPPPDVTPLPQYSLGLVETPFPPVSLVSSLDGAREQRLSAEKTGQMFRCVPKSPTTSFYQPVVIPMVKGKSVVRGRTIALMRPPRLRKRGVMVHLSALCLCLFVLVSVLLILSPVT